MEDNTSINFIVPELNLNYRLIRQLIIIKDLSYSSKGNPVLNLVKIGIFDFLVKYPHILKQLLETKKRKLELLNSERKSIETLYPSKNEFLDINKTKTLLIIMLKFGLVEVSFKNEEIFYVISDKGRLFINDLDIEEILRISELTDYLQVLKSVSNNELTKSIMPLIKGV
ncbi:MAG: ABC-three component system middle component 4 [Solibacillus sp.]